MRLPPVFLHATLARSVSGFERLEEHHVLLKGDHGRTTWLADDLRALHAEEKDAVVAFVPVLADPHQVFPAPFFGAGSVSSGMAPPASAFVDRVAQCGTLPALKLAQNLAWQKDILDKPRNLARLEQEKSPWYVYEVLVRLSEIWLVLISHVTLPEASKTDVSARRMSRILQCIEQHYGEDLTLSNLASASAKAKHPAVSTRFSGRLRTGIWLNTGFPRPPHCSPARIFRSGRSPAGLVSTA